jgi:hypothetical protein
MKSIQQILEEERNKSRLNVDESLINRTIANKTKDYSLVKQINKDRANDPKWLEGVANGIEKRKNNKTWKENNKNQLNGNHEKRKKPVMTPDGKFDSIRSAAAHYGKHETTIMNRIVKGHPGYFYIDKE